MLKKAKKLDTHVEQAPSLFVERVDQFTEAVQAQSAGADLLAQALPFRLVE